MKTPKTQPLGAVAKSRLVRHPLFWLGLGLGAVGAIGGISAAWGFAAGCFITTAMRESRVPNAKDLARRALDSE